MKFTLPAEIRHNQTGFETLVRLHAQTKDCFFDDVDIDMVATSWFDADMCAVFGAILYQLSEKLNKNRKTIRLINICPEIKNILSKNGFLSHYGRGKIPDCWGTTIRYQRFNVEDDRFFADYVETELMCRSELPAMSSGLLKKFGESIFEIFSNAVLHSQSKRGIFSCGQSFPKRHRLNFSVADLGIGIRQNVRENARLDLAPEDAIAWATEGRNTTKHGQIPGGLGLKLLKEFIDLNGGRIQIVSDAGYWRREKSKTTLVRFGQPFPGTIVSVEINTAGIHSYELVPELSEADIF